MVLLLCNHSCEFCAVDYPTMDLQCWNDKFDSLLSYICKTYAVDSLKNFAFTHIDKHFVSVFGSFGSGSFGLTFSLQHCSCCVILTCDRWHVTCDTWHVTRDMWHVTYDNWHVTHDTWQMTNDMWHVTRDTCHILWDEWMNQWINHGGDCITTTATPGLLNRLMCSLVNVRIISVWKCTFW